MATDLTFISEVFPYEGWAPGDKYELPLKLYDADNTKTQAVARFVKQSGRTVAQGGDKQFAIMAEGDAALGVLIAHTHDASGKEFYDPVAFDEEARVIVWAHQPVWVEADTAHGTGAITASAGIKPMTPVASSAGGLAKVAEATEKINGYALRVKAVGTKTYVLVKLLDNREVTV